MHILSYQIQPHVHSPRLLRPALHFITLSYHVDISGESCGCEKKEAQYTIAAIRPAVKNMLVLIRNMPAKYTLAGNYRHIDGIGSLGAFNDSYGKRDQANAKSRFDYFITIFYYLACCFFGKRSSCLLFPFFRFATLYLYSCAAFVERFYSPFLSLCRLLLRRVSITTSLCTIASFN